MQGIVNLYETRLEMRDKHQERLKGFFKRQLDRKEKYAIELRDELNVAKGKLNAIEHSNKKAQRNIHVAQEDLDRDRKNMTQSMVKQVQKVAQLLGSVRNIRTESAAITTHQVLASSRREAKLSSANRVRSLIFLFACFCS
jgi:hypothetical protein